MIDSPDLIKRWRSFFDVSINQDSRLVDGYIDYIIKLNKISLPPIFELKHLSELVGIRETILVQVLQNSNTFYRDFTIPKRLGGRRKISVPSPLLLEAQRWINDEILSRITVHDAAHGFIKNRSIVTNANKHLRCVEALKMDLENFFPSIKFSQVMNVFLECGYPVNVSYFLSSICCRDKQLPQGAATSPSLSNIIAKQMDTRISQYSDETDLIYTRYADDLVLSGKKIERGTVEKISWIIEDTGFSVNKKKTRLLRENSQKIITGISISTNKLALPRKSVRSIKHETYHLIKHGYSIHAHKTKNYDPLLMERLLGKIAFWLQIDPSNPTAKSLQQKLKKYISEFNP